MKIITGGQSGADLAGNYFAKKHNIETEINAEKGYKPLYDPVPQDIKVNIVSKKYGKDGGWIERRKYNIKNSDFTLILVDKPLSITRGSFGTAKDCERYRKPYIYLDIYKNIGEYCIFPEGFHGLPLRGITYPSLTKSFIKSAKFKVINIAGQRDLNKEDAIKFLEMILLG